MRRTEERRAWRDEGVCDILPYIHNAATFPTKSLFDLPCRRPCKAAAGLRCRWALRNYSRNDECEPIFGLNFKQEKRVSQVAFVSLKIHLLPVLHLLFRICWHSQSGSQTIVLACRELQCSFILIIFFWCRMPLQRLYAHF